MLFQAPPARRNRVARRRSNIDCGVPSALKGNRMKRRVVMQLLAGCLAAAAWGGMPSFALAADEAPDAMIKRLSDEVLAAIKADKAIQAGDTNRILALVDSKIMPNVNFQRMTAAAVGP